MTWGDAMKRVLGAVTVLAMIGVAVGAAVPAAADEPDSPSTTIVDALSESAAKGATSPEDLSRATGLALSGPGSLAVDDEGLISANVAFAAAPTAAQLAAVRRVAEIDRELRFVNAVTVSVRAGDLRSLEAISGVASVVPIIRPSVGSLQQATPATLPTVDPDTCRVFPSDAVGPLHADIAARDFGVDGTGQTVGILSDSFAASKTPPTTPQQDVALGVLPGPGNPCGYTEPVEVLADAAPGGGDDEGRAMAQLVHGIAPGARLMFHTAFGGQLGMADGILALAEAGATVIVDDISYTDEPHYQRGLVSAAIEQVRRQGVAYYTSAGNWNAVGKAGGPSAGRPITSWETTAYRPAACPAWVVVPAGVTSYDCLDFGAPGASDPTDTLFFGGATKVTAVAGWSDPMYSIQSQLQPQLYVDSPEGPQPVGSGGFFDSDAPMTFIGTGSGPKLQGRVELVVVRDTTAPIVPATPAVWITFVDGGSHLDWREHDASRDDVTVGLSASGHGADGSAVSVAAVNWRTPTVPEDFTAPGGGLLYFQTVDPATRTPSPAYPQPIAAPGPQLAAVDGNRTSFFDRPVAGETGYFFFGTSAAAPNAAAVHALAAQYAPEATETQILDTARATTASMVNPYSDYLTAQEVFGTGLIDAAALLGALPARPVTGLGATALSATSIAAEWTAVQGAAGYRAELLAGSDVVDTASLTSSQTAVTFVDLLPETAYSVRVAAVNSASQAGSAVTAAVTTPRTPQPATPPATPAQSDLGPAPAAALSISSSSVAAGDAVTVSGLPARTWVYGWLFSDPTVLGWAWTGASGSASFTIPSSVPAGSHRLAVRAADGTQLGWVGLTVTTAAAAPAPAAVTASLARTGLETDMSPVVGGSVALLVLGGVLVAFGVRRRATR